MIRSGGDDLVERLDKVSTPHMVVRLIENFNALRSSRKIEDCQLGEEIKKAIDELENIRSYFDTVSEPELIEYAIYREKSVLIRLSYLLKKAKYSETFLESSSI